jgi:hypothetical protein
MKELERLQEKERKKQMKAIEKRTSALQKY